MQASGLIEGEHYFRQEFLKDERGEAIINEESGQKMQPDIIVKYPDEREMIIDSKVSLTAYAAYTSAESKEEQAHFLKAHIDSRIGLIASIMMSCTETIFYTMSVYFMAAKVRKTTAELAVGDRFVISKAANHTKICKLHQRSFLEILRKKMGNYS